MTDVTIEVLPDAATSSGTAVIRLNGLWLLPTSATYQIEPSDRDIDTATPGAWPVGELKPREVRVTAAGVELVVGPEVTGATELKPDTLVEISVPHAALRSTARWPMLGTVDQSGKEGPGEHVVSDLDADADRPLAVRNAETAVEMSLAKLAAALATGQQPAAAATVAGLVSAPTSPMPGSDAQQVPLDLAIASVREATVKQTTLQAPNHDLLSLDKQPRREPQGPLQLGLPAPLSSRGQVVTRTRLIPAEARRNHAVLPFAAGLFTAAFLTMAVWAFTPPARSIRDTAKATVVQRTAASEAALRFDQFFKLAPTSPRGTAVAEVSPAQSFELADRHLQSGAPEERLEAEFWLKRGLAMTLAGGTNSWALTQLGTLLVDQSTRTPDYDRARVLWELAASQGDTVAMCFLGTLYEQGLGVAASKSTALNYFSQSKASGGCRGVDAAIARLKE